MRAIAWLDHQEGASNGATDIAITTAEHQSGFMGGAWGQGMRPPRHAVRVCLLSPMQTGVASV